MSNIHTKRLQYQIEGTNRYLSHVVIWTIATKTCLLDPSQTRHPLLCLVVQEVHRQIDVVDLSTLQDGIAGCTLDSVIARTRTREDARFDFGLLPVSKILHPKTPLASVFAFFRKAYFFNVCYLKACTIVSPGCDGNFPVVCIHNLIDDSESESSAIVSGRIV